MPKIRDGVYTRPNRKGFWIGWNDAQGRRRQMKTVAPTLQQARDILAKKRADAEKQRVMGYAPPTEDTFDQFALVYLKHQQARLTPKAYQRTKGVVEKHLTPLFGRMRLADLRRDGVEKYVTQRRPEVAKATVAKELNILKHLLAVAVGKELIPFNHAHGVRPYEKPPEYRTEYLLPEQVPLVLEKCPDWLQPIVLLLLATGMRRGEVLGLRWSFVKRAQSQILLPTTKNGKPRVVHLNALACRVLDSLPRAADHVFPENSQHSPEDVSLTFLRACRRAQILNFRLHDLRHTCASWMAMRGVGIHTIATQLGHDVKQSARYAHFSDPFLQGAVRSLDGVFGPELADRRQLSALALLPRQQCKSEFIVQSEFIV